MSDAPATTTGVAPGVVSAFRAAAFAEAASWTGLLVSMAFKYTGHGAGGVHVFGPIHGGLFVLYVLLAIPAARAAGYSARGTLLVMAASIPPYTSLLAERRVAHDAVRVRR
ncbi:MAG: DUF3817 domain-containing protein [Thermoleophilia bacterium]|nr:DUF3817 domain-containing protein [Thermoleophilia bacterium]